MRNRAGSELLLHILGGRKSTGPSAREGAGSFLLIQKRGTGGVTTAVAEPQPTTFCRAGLICLGTVGATLSSLMILSQDSIFGCLVLFLKYLDPGIL